MKYTVELYKASELVAEQTVTAPGKTECKGQIYPDLPFGVEVEIKADEPDDIWARVKFFEGQLFWYKDFDLKNGHGAAFWDTTSRHDMQVVIRPFGT